MLKNANAPCSWGALEFNLQGKPAAYRQVLDEMNETGYAGTELGDWAFMPTDPARLKTEKVIQKCVVLFQKCVPDVISRN